MNECRGTHRLLRMNGHIRRLSVWVWACEYRVRQYRLRHSINASGSFSRDIGTREEHGAIMAAVDTGNVREAVELVRAHMQHLGANVLAATDKSELLSLALVGAEKTTKKRRKKA